MKPRKLMVFIIISLAILVGIQPGRSVYAVVDLLYFYAIPGTDSIDLTWETATEFDNIGFYVQRGLIVGGPFTRISPLILSSGDPLSGHIYSYEDASVEIGVLYYYVLEILNADNTSDFTIPVSAIIPAPTATPTITPTQTQVSVVTSSPTSTATPTTLAASTITPASELPTQTATITPAPTATHTCTPTTTLEPISISGLDFPANSPTGSNISAMVTGETHIPGDVNEVLDTPTPVPGERIQAILILVVMMWVTLVLLLFFGIRYINRNVRKAS